MWNLEDDPFNHVELANNWDRIDALLDTLDSEITPGPKRIQTLPSLPTTGNFIGRLVMLNSANGGFAAMSLMKFDGSSWRPVATPEILPTVPTAGNFAGRVVMLSQANGGFEAWTLIRYNGSTWAGIGGTNIDAYSSGVGALKINGIATAGDMYFSQALHGIVMIDRTTGTKRRLYFDQGVLGFEVVT